ncbi:MAG: hypothetical protein Q7T51_01880 [Candidatus Moranbacteria bacterium]|nr:hypothetical protein [Candidatus Moranbacteria bacterium]
MTNLKREEQPSRTYSNELIKKCQNLIFERSGKKITEDEAELHMDKLSRLGMVFINGALAKMKQTQDKASN